MQVLPLTQIIKKDDLHHTREFSRVRTSLREPGLRCKEKIKFAGMKKYKAGNC
ncbi:MAG: hypothetical protein KDD15_07835 [Lewinella sp.]|nr:hypothetical protein [Lewinella sp.]